MSVPSAQRKTLLRNCLLAVGALVVAAGLSLAILWWARFREPSWWLDSQAVPVEVDPALTTRLAEAVHLPISRKERPHRRGTFVVDGDDELDIDFGTGDGFSGKWTELRLRRHDGGTVTGTCLATATWDYGPPFSGALRELSGRVRVSSSDWTRGSTLLVAFELDGRIGSERSPREALLRIDIP